jgi:pimeloyl-ACP methyl ester carboxylesterase
MRTQRTHCITTTDGVTIGGTVHGQGPSLVFLQGGVGDGDLDWQAVVPHVADRFTCYLPSLRGRGRSGDHADLSTGRQADDVIAYLDSIGAPTGLVGWSYGAGLALAVAAHSDAVTAVASYEPAMLGQMDEQEQTAAGDAAARAAELVADGKLPAAVRAFVRWPFTDDDIAGAEKAGYFEAAGRYIANLLNHLRQNRESDDPTSDPAVLGAISVPVVVLKGSETKPLFTASAQYVVDHVPNAQVHEIAGAGHAGPLTHPEALAEALLEVFSPTRQRA